MASLATIYQDAAAGRDPDSHLIGFADAATLEMDGRYGIFLTLTSSRPWRTTPPRWLMRWATAPPGPTHVPLPAGAAQHEIGASTTSTTCPFRNPELVADGYTEPWQLAEATGWPECAGRTNITLSALRLHAPNLFHNNLFAAASRNGGVFCFE